MIDAMLEDWIVVDKSRDLEAQWIQRHRKAHKDRMAERSKVRRVSAKSTATARKKVSRADLANRLTMGRPATEDVFTARSQRRPSSAPARRIVNLKPGDGKVELVSTPRLMGSLQGFVREHRSLRSVGLMGVPMTPGAMFRVGARAKVRDTLQSKQPITTRVLHDMAEEAIEAVAVPGHLQKGINEPTTTGPPLTFYAGNLF